MVGVDARLVAGVVVLADGRCVRVSALVRLARLKDDEARGTLPLAGLGALQQLEDRFGLSPKARRALSWEVAQAAVDAPERPVGSVPKLRAVSDA